MLKRHCQVTGEPDTETAHCNTLSLPLVQQTLSLAPPNASVFMSASQHVVERLIYIVRHSLIFERTRPGRALESLRAWYL